MRLLVAKLQTVEYREALEIQQRLLRLRQQGAIEDTLLLLEHPSVITIGRGGDEEHVVASPQFLQQQDVPTYKINRGGDVTYHGPGQIVGYPVMDLRQQTRDVHDFIRKIEEVFIWLLWREYGIAATRDAEHRGVWVGGSKIVAVGCAIKRWVSMHGFAFNVNTQLENFAWIIPCGIHDKGVTSLQETVGRPCNVAEVTDQVCCYFADTFQMQPEVKGRAELYRMIGGEHDGYSPAKLDQSKYESAERHGPGSHDYAQVVSPHHL